MVILFICGSLNEGKDGVGDYTRKLASVLHQKGIKCIALSLNDVITTPEIESKIQQFEGEEVLYLRLDKSSPIDEKAKFLERALANLQPDLISFQFVIYGIHPRGWLFSFNRSIAIKVIGYRIHLMWHELWIGQLRTSSLLHRIEGLVQRKSVLDFLEIVKPRFQDTSIPFYQALLQRNGIKAGLLPLFSNISSKADETYDLKSIFGVELCWAEFSIFVCFGTIFSEFPFDHWLKEARRWSETAKRKILFCSIGKQGRGVKTWETWLDKTKEFDWIKLRSLGPLEPEQIQSVFNQSDVGVCLTPLEGWGKSGSVAAMLENGLYVMGYEFGIAPPSLHFQLPTKKEIIQMKLDIYNAWPQNFERNNPKDALEEVANLFITNVIDKIS